MTELTSGPTAASFALFSSVLTSVGAEPTAPGTLVGGAGALFLLPRPGPFALRLGGAGRRLMGAGASTASPVVAGSEMTTCEITSPSTVWPSGTTRS
jgi:hypothetical protein